VFEATELSYNPPTGNQKSDIDLPTLKYKYGELSASLANFPKWEKQGSFGDMLGGSLSIGFICVLETLITAKIADNIAGAKVPFDLEGEVVATGISNALVGVMGGLPCTAVLARTKLNIMSGTKGQASQFINALLCIVIVVGLLPFFSYVPLSIIACILCLVAVRMAPIETLFHLWRQDKTEFSLMVFVCAVSVGLDPTYGLVGGMIIAFFINADNVSKVHTELQMLKKHEAETLSGIKRRPMHTVTAPGMRSRATGAIMCNPMTVEAEEVSNDTDDKTGVSCFEPWGALTYLNADGLEEQMKTFLGMPHLVIAMDKVYFMDIDGVDRVGKMVKRLRDEGTMVVLCGSGGKGIELLPAANWFKDLQEAGFVVEARSEAHKFVAGKDLEMEIVANGNAITWEPGNGPCERQCN